MDKYPFGNFRDNPPWPVCLWNQSSVFNAGAQGPITPHIFPPGFSLDQMGTQYMPYGVMPVLIHTNPFMNNFSFPPPHLPLQNHVDIRFHENSLNPLLVPNEYYLFQAQSNQSDLVGADVINKQSSTDQLQKHYKVRDQTTSRQQNPIISQVKNTPCTNTTDTVSGDRVNGFNFQQHQNQEQRQPTQQNIETLSEHIKEKVKLPGTPKVDVVDKESTVVENTVASVVVNTKCSVKVHYQTNNQNEDPVIKQEQIDFQPKSNVRRGGNLSVLNPDTNTPAIASVNKKSEINKNFRAVLNQDANYEQEAGTFQEEPTDIQELIKEQSKQPIQPHQYFINSRDIKPTQTQFHQDKKEYSLRFHNNKSEIRNGGHQGSQPIQQQRELPNWLHRNNGSPQNIHNTSQYSYQQAVRQTFQQTHQTINTLLLENAQFGEKLLDSYKPRLNTDIRLLRNGNRHNKSSERSSSNDRETIHPTKKVHSLESTVEERLSRDFYKYVPPCPNMDKRFTKDRSQPNKESETASTEQRRNTDPSEGNIFDGQKSANFKFRTSRYYINRHFTSKS